MVTVDKELKLKVSFNLSDSIGSKGSQKSKEHEHSDYSTVVSYEAGVILTQTGLNEGISDVERIVI